MKYLVRDIPQGHAKGLNESFSVSPATLGFLEDEITIDGNIKGRLTLWREDAMVTIQGELSTTISLQCCRCLTGVIATLHPVIALRCLPEASTADDTDETGEVTPEDNVYTYTGMFLNIRPIIREQVLLAVPPYSYCRSDCHGLCIVCGQDLNTAPCACVPHRSDPRFARLQSLKRTLE